MKCPGDVKGGPSSCEFDPDKLTLKIDFLIRSEVEAIALAVDKLMRWLKKTCRRPDQEFAVEMALRVAGMEGDEAIVKPRKGIVVGASHASHESSLAAKRLLFLVIMPRKPGRSGRRGARPRGSQTDSAERPWLRTPCSGRARSARPQTRASFLLSP